jgi:putative membrane protein
MTNPRIVAVFAAASALVMAGCSKDEGAETAEPTATEGSETTTTTSVEQWRAEEELPEEERVEDPGVVAEPTMVDPRMQDAAKSASPLTDGEIAKITDVVNQGEIEQGQLAKSKAKDADVKKFAQHMIAEHTKAKQSGQKLVKQQQLITQDNAVATDLSNGAEETLQSLRGAQGAEFDRQYIASQVDQHQKVLDMLDKQLIPSADSPELKAELAKAREMVEKHLTEARELQQELAQDQP